MPNNMTVVIIIFISISIQVRAWSAAQENRRRRWSDNTVA